MADKNGVTTEIVHSLLMRERTCEDAIQYVLDTYDLKSPVEPIKARNTPKVLLKAIRDQAQCRHQSARTVVKCLAFHGISLIRGIEDVKDLNRKYRAICRFDSEHIEMLDVIEYMAPRSYCHGLTGGEIDYLFNIPESIIPDYAKAAKGLQMSVGALLYVGMAWSLSTSEDGRMSSIASRLKSAPLMLLRYVREQGIYMDAHMRIAKERLAEAGVSVPSGDDDDDDSD